MKRKDFLDQLEYLLQDVDESDRQDALDYYRDYMDEAGVYDMDDVGDLFDRPEKVALSIRASLNDDPDEQIEVSEHGFKHIHTEEQTNVPNLYKHTEHTETEEAQDAEWHSASESEEKIYEAEPEKSLNLNMKLILIIATCLVLSPVILGLGSGVIGLVFGIIGGIIGLTFGVGGAALGCLVGGAVLLVKSVLRIAVSVPQGIFMMGIALLILAVGILLVILTIIIFKRFIPWIIQSVRSLIQKIK